MLLTQMLTTSILGLQFANIPLHELTKHYIPQLISTAPFTRLITVNPEIVIQSSHSTHIMNLLQTGICVADGIGITLIHRLKYHTRLHRIPGIDLVTELTKSPYRIYIVGSTPETLTKALQNLAKQPCHIIGSHHGFFPDHEEARIISNIANASPDIVLVAMGYPKQELLLKKLENHLQNGIGIGIGGALDILAGTYKRAPKLIRTLGLEWAWRILINPSRLRRLKWITQVPTLFR
jgi:N-acetylglucosaminyldiphosphoundecaprenol N-acetyl-beta-D-mannosaminyltransferase